MKSVPQEVLAFLRQLEQNNDRDWFNDHKAEFKALESEMPTIMKIIPPALNSPKPADIGSSPKKLIPTDFKLFSNGPMKVAKLLAST